MTTPRGWCPEASQVTRGAISMSLFQDTGKPERLCTFWERVGVEASVELLFLEAAVEKIPLVVQYEGPDAAGELVGGWIVRTGRLVLNAQGAWVALLHNPHEYPAQFHFRVYATREDAAQVLSSAPPPPNDTDPAWVHRHPQRPR